LRKEIYNGDNKLFSFDRGSNPFHLDCLSIIMSYIPQKGQCYSCSVWMDRNKNYNDDEEEEKEEYDYDEDYIDLDKMLYL